LCKYQRVGGIVCPKGCSAFHSILGGLRKIESVRPENHRATHRGSFDEILTTKRAQ
jgi:hypothetical protein